VVFPAPVGPTIATVWPGVRDQGQVPDQLAVGAVGEADVLELDPALADAGRGGGHRGLGLLLLGVQQLEDPLGAGHAGLQHRRHRGDLGERLGELAGVLDEGLHIAEGQLAGDDPQPAHDRDDDVAEVPHEHHQRHDQRGDELGAEGGAEQGLVALLEAGGDLVASAEDGHQRVPGVGLLDLGVHHARRVPLLGEELLRPRADHARDHERHGDHRERDERELPGDHQHHHQHAEHREDRVDQARDGVHQGVLDVVDVVGDPGEDLPALHAVEVPQRQAVQLLLDVAAQAGDHPHQDPVQRQALQPHQQRGEGEEADGQAQGLVERREVDALAGGEGHAREHVRELLLPLGAQSVDHLGGIGARGEVLRDQAGEEDVGGAAEDLRPHHGEGHGDHADEDRGEQIGPLGPHLAHQALGGGPEVLRALPGAEPARGVLLGGDLGGGAGLVARGLRGVLGAHQATSSSTPWLRTISW
jgi:hypothetical protein